MANNKNPLVSVIIPTYNSARYIRESIDSVSNQTYKNLEIIVVDDGSTDDTRKILEQYARKIKYIYKGNGGPASARNRGIREAKGDLIAFLDADDLWEPKKLKIQLDFFESNPQVGLVYSDIMTINSRGTTRLKRKSTKSASRNEFVTLFMRNFITNSAVMVRKKCFEDMGYFDEAKELIANEDYDMWLRIASKYELGYIAKPLVIYRMHDKGISRNHDRLYLGEKMVVEKNLASFAHIYPDIKKLYRKRLSRLFFEFGYEYFADKKYAEARDRFATSIRHHLLNVKSIKCYLLTFLMAGGSVA